MMGARILALLLMGVTALVPAPLAQGPAGAEQTPVAPAAGNGEVGSTGRFNTEIPIRVPAFRDLEPKLGLRYDSGTGNGFAGMGWTVGGVSVVERAAPMRGSPRYDANDAFLLDGQELLPCTTFGGTHCPRQQSFQRITRDTAANRWLVWDKDGTKSVYDPVYTSARGTFRWALTSETDTHANAVSYSYWRPPGGNAYLDSVSYNGTLVKLWRESRAYPAGDPVGVANGDLVEYTDHRLKTIQVSTGGRTARAYALSYQMAPSTHRSRLVSVRQYGSDATVDSSGTVTAGTALPPVTLGWQDGQARFGGSQASDSGVGVWDPDRIKDLFGDVNGDGKADLVRPYRKSGALAGHDAWAQVHLSNGTAYTSKLDGEVGGWNDATVSHLADATGDGRADLLRVWQCGDSTCVQLNASTGAAYSAGASTAVGGWNPTYFRDYFADVDSDSRVDFVRVFKSGEEVRVQVNRSDGAGFDGQNCNATIGTWQDSARDHLADVNGDGRADLIRIFNGGNGNAWASVRLSDGRCFSPVWQGEIGAVPCAFTPCRRGSGLSSNGTLAVLGRRTLPRLR